MIERTRDVGRINEILNHPEVRPFLGDRSSAHIDFTNVIANDLHIILLGEHGGFALIWTAPKVYELHTYILHEGRGIWAKKAASEGFSILFNDYGAEKIWTRISQDNKRARIFAKICGFKHIGSMLDNLGAGVEIVDIFEVKTCPQL